MAIYTYDRSASGTPSAKLQALITAAASASKTYIPTQVTKTLPQTTQVVGPNANQNIVRIPYDPSPAGGVKSGTNRIIFGSQMHFASNIRLEIDSGVQIVDGTNAFGMFVTHLFNNWSIVVGDATRNGGYFSVDCSYQPSNLKSCLTHIHNSDHWSIEWLESKQYRTGNNTACCVIPMHAIAGDTPGPTTVARNFLYRHHKNTNSGPGWGPNQIGGAYNAWIEDMQSNGGTALRLETDGAAAGIHNVHAEQCYCENGNYVVTCTPHAVDSDHVVILDVRGVNNNGGLFVGGPGQGGQFHQLTVTGGCICGSAGHAQTPVDGQPPTPTFNSTAVVEDGSTSGTVTISGIGRSGTFYTGHTGSTVNSSPGGSGSVACSIAIAQGGTVTPPTPPPPPTLNGAVFSSTRIDLNWTAVTGATAYEVKRGGVTIATVTTLSYSNTGLSPSTSYSYTVDAIWSGSAQPNSNTVTLTTLASVTAIQLPSNTSGTVEITAASSNQAAVLIGGSSVTPSGGGSVFTELRPGQAMIIDIANSNALYWIPLVTGDFVTVASA